MFPNMPVVASPFKPCKCISTSFMNCCHYAVNVLVYICKSPKQLANFTSCTLTIHYYFASSITKITKAFKIGCFKSVNYTLIMC